MIGLRGLWGIAFERPRAGMRALALLAMALAIPVAIAAVQVLPFAEVHLQSARSLPITKKELDAYHPIPSLAALRNDIGVCGSGWQSGLFSTALLVFAAARPRSRRRGPTTSAARSPGLGSSRS